MHIIGNEIAIDLFRKYKQQHWFTPDMNEVNKSLEHLEFTHFIRA